jgi:dihydroorotate dehydrogenase electron transfer subunit
MTTDWPRDEAPIEGAEWIEKGVNPDEEAEVLPAPSPRFSGAAMVVRQVETKPDHFTARVTAPEIAASCRPGQFLHVLCGETLDPLLRRPISISRANRDEGWVEFIYRVVGAGTHLLAEAHPGTILDIMGPLGTPFALKDGPGRHILVGGGVGIPPMLFLAETLLQSRKTEDITVLLGGRTADLLLCEGDFEGLGLPPRLITDDGSAGRTGLVTHLLDEALREASDATVYACGPVPMLRAVARVAEQHGRPCQVSFEARMACGVGACLSCVIPTDTGYQRVCTEGPAFPAESVIWTAELNLH